MHNETRRAKSKIKHCINYYGDRIDSDKDRHSLIMRMADPHIHTEQYGVYVQYAVGGCPIYQRRFPGARTGSFVSEMTKGSRLQSQGDQTKQERSSGDGERAGTVGGGGGGAGAGNGGAAGFAAGGGGSLGSCRGGEY